MRYLFVIVPQDFVLTNKLMYTTSVLAVIAAMIVRGCIYWKQ